MIKTTITSEITHPVDVNDSFNGMTIYLNQDKDTIEMSIDQSAKVAVEILNHVQEMQNKHLKKG